MKLNFKPLNISKFFWNLIAFFPKHSFFTVFLCLLISSSLACYMFYAFQFIAGQGNIAGLTSVKLREDAYNSIIKAWDEEEERAEESKSYKNVFYIAPVPSPVPSPIPSSSPHQ